MKARVFVTLKPSVFDPQGHTIAEALHSLVGERVVLHAVEVLGHRVVAQPDAGDHGRSIHACLRVC